MLEDKERNFWMGFSVFPGIGPMKFKKLLDRFGSAQDAWQAPKSDLEKVIGEKLAEEFDEFRNKFSVIDYARILLRKGVSLLTLKDEGYPGLLKKIRNPPFLLYFKGDATTLYSSSEGVPDGTPEARSSKDDSSRLTSFARTIRPTIAIVGTRRTTQYGREVTKILTQDLVAVGFIIVSGLAIGVDAISHKTALDGGGKTIAVLGCGADCCYPRENQNLYYSIVNGGGCIVSEYPLGQSPTRGSFPARNRILAGLSMGVLVTEGAEDSGSLITANYALRFNRPVFAVPGPITSSMSKGPYKLIAKGAKLVTSGEDILRELKITNSKSQIPNKSQSTKFKTATKEEQEILKLLENEPMHFDELVRRTGFDSSKVGSILSVMEIKGMIKSLESGFFSISS